MYTVDILMQERNTGTINKDKRKMYCRQYSSAERAEAHEKLKLAAQNFLLKVPFFGFLLSRQKLVEASVWLPTAGVDGKHFYYNVGFINDLKVIEVQFLLCHELLHLIYGHLSRGAHVNGVPRIHSLFNIANDYIVNADSFQTLEEFGLVQAPSNCFMNVERFRGYVSEEIYDELLKEIIEKIKKDKKEQQAQKDQNASQDQGDGECSGEGMGEGTSEGQGQQNNSNEQNSSEEITKEDIEKAINEKYPNGTFDDHFDLTGNDEQSNNHDGDDIKDNGDGTLSSNRMPDLSKNAMDKKLEALKGDIMIAKGLLSEKDLAGVGNVPAGVIRVIRELEEPVFNWKRHIKKHILDLKRNRISWTTPKRRDNESGIIMPGKRNNKKYKIHVSLDTSGSISEEELRDFLSEVYGAARQLKNLEVTIWTFDTSIYNEQTYNKNNIHRIKEYKIYGNGGTDFYQNWVYMQEQRIRPDLFIMFTDGECCGEPGIKGYCDTLYVIHNERKIDRIPKEYGKTIFYDRKKKSR